MVGVLDVAAYNGLEVEVAWDIDNCEELDGVVLVAVLGMVWWIREPMWWRGLWLLL